MSVLLETWNQVTALAPSTGGAHHQFLADSGYFPDSDPEPLPGKAQSGLQKAIGMLKTVLYAAAVIAFLFVCVGMILGLRGRSNFAKDAVQHMPWIFGGVIGAGAVVGILDTFV